MEEKISRIKEFARMVKKFEDNRSAKCSEILFETILLPEYIKFPSLKLASIFKWLFHNWKQYSRPFPEVPEFEQARKETATHKGIDTWDKDWVNKEHSPEDMSLAFSEVKKSLPQTIRVDSIKKHSQVSLMKRMAEEGKVYSVAHRVWVKKELKHKLPGQIVDPGATLKKYDSVTERMRV
jgi:hypothetical protein